MNTSETKSRNDADNENKKEKQPKPKAIDNIKGSNKNQCCPGSAKKDKPESSKSNNNFDNTIYSPPPTIQNMKIPRSYPLQSASPSIATPKRSLYNAFMAL